MARPRTRIRKSYEELLAENAEKVQKHEAAIRMLEQEREALLKAKRDEELQALYSYMKENSLSAQEVLENLKGTQSEERAVS